MNKIRIEVRSQAEQVTVWCRGATDGRSDGYEYVIRNSSNKPISQLVIGSPTDNGQAMTAIGVVDRTEERISAADPPPFEATFWPSPVEFWFFDASGRYWYRNGYGQLYRWTWWTRRRTGLLDKHVSPRLAQRRLRRLPRALP